MARATYFAAKFLAGCVAASQLGQVATLHPAFFRFSALVAVVAVVIWISLWVLDDWVIAVLNCDRTFYYGYLISAAICALLGGGVILWMQF